MARMGGMIPKIIHQVWLGQRPLPDEFVRYRETWTEHHPDWEFRLWTEENLPATLIRPEIRDRLRNPVERSDMLRLEVVHASGGVYVDTDIECLRPIDKLINGLDFFVADTKLGSANNAVIGAVPQHPIVLEVIRACRPRECHGYDKEATGPLLMNRVLLGHPEVKVFEPWVFYPLNVEQRSRAFAIHHVERSWKDEEGFRKAARVAEERLREMQNELLGVVREVNAVLKLSDTGQLRARLQELSSRYGQPESSANAQSGDQFHGNERRELGIIPALLRIAKKLHMLEQIHRRLGRLDRGIDRLTLRLETLERQGKLERAERKRLQKSLSTPPAE